MAKIDENLSMVWNPARGWLAKFKKPDGTWGSKTPTVDGKPNGEKFSAGEEIGASLELRRWYYSGGRENKPAIPLNVGAKTLKALGPEWIKMCEMSNKSTNYVKTLRSNMNVWIIDSIIGEVDLEKDFDVPLILQWIRSLEGKASSKLVVIGALTNFFQEMIGVALDENMANPMKKPRVMREIKALNGAVSKAHIVAAFSKEQITTLLTSDKNIPDWRRIKYTIAVGTGLRDNEIHGLAWSHVKLDAIHPHIEVVRQLLRSGRDPVFTAPKFDSRRVVPLHPLVVAALKYWQRTGWRLVVGRNPEPNDPIMPFYKASTPDMIGKYTQSLSAELLRDDLVSAGLPTSFVADLNKGEVVFTFHAMRRTFYSLLRSAGVSEADCELLAGHAGGSVGEQNYHAPELAYLHSQIAKLPLPTFVQLKSKRIVDEKASKLASVSTFDDKMASKIA